jgi:EAL domain-containing protein (putative c-di-GMP-specific phosphodiesterase class I)
MGAAHLRTVRRRPHTRDAPGKLTLEITETAMLEDLEEATRVLQELRGLGVRVALDDFGAGYSSLRYLDRLPVDIVKIDRSFIASLDNPDKRATLLAITRLLDTIPRQPPRARHRRPRCRALALQGQDRHARGCLSKPGALAGPLPRR